MAHQSVIKVLVTGFGPFPGMHDNPSGALVRRIEQERFGMPPGISLRTAIIPTSWEAVEQFVLKDLAAFNPDIALHFGVSSQARGFRIERIARNVACTAADCEGKTFTRLRPANGTPSTHHASIDAERLVQRLRKRGLEAITSHDAGRYICNMLLYLSLNQSFVRRHRRQTGFIHIPPIGRNPHHAGPLDRDSLLTGTQIILDHCIGIQRRLNRPSRGAV